MSSSDYAIRVQGIGKQYRIGTRQTGGAYSYKSLGDTLARSARRPIKTLCDAVFRGPPDEANSFWALRDVNFEVKRGEIVGIIGRNGAGKSTLLKVLSRITKPTTGEIELRGRVGSLLEVGTGFHPELTGRENIFLNGAVLGMTTAEVRARFDEIIAFSEIERFLDTPVKQYSSGMYMRLAFAVAAHLDPEILVIDEVLAVGDIEFQRKCLGRMHDVAQAGRTVLFVSHNLTTMSGFCDSGVVLREGRCVHSGPFSESVSNYLSQLRDHGILWPPPDRRTGSGEVRFEKFILDGTFARPAQALTFKWSVKSQNVLTSKKFFLSCHVQDEMGACVAQCDSRLNGLWIESAERQDGTLVVRGPWLKPGKYSLDIGIIGAHGMVDEIKDSCRFIVDGDLPYQHSAGEIAIAYAPILADFHWQAEGANS